MNSSFKLKISALLIVSALIALVAFWSRKDPPTENSEREPAPNSEEIAEGIAEAPGLGKNKLIGPLADAWDRIDPTKDGWDTEAINEKAGAQLALLKAALAEVDPSARNLDGLAAEGFRSAGLRPDNLAAADHDGGEFAVRRWDGESPAGLEGDLAATLDGLRSVFAPDSTLQLETKLYKIEPGENGAVSTAVLFHAAAKSAAGGGRLQINAEWLCRWQTGDGEPLLTGIELQSYEEVERTAGGGAPLLADCTASVLGGNPSYSQHLMRSSDFWRARLPQNFGIDVVSNVGMTLADFNGDDLDDLYLCQQGGLPNRLYLQRADGTLEDATETSGTDWLDFTASALAIDLDNDGDQDLVVALQFRLVLMRNDGAARFEIMGDVPLRAQTFSITAADYDLDGDLDIYTCGYNASSGDLRESGALGSPVPFHDAKNGGGNTLLRNTGGFSFLDVTEESGLGKENNRFSFSAAWEDYDLDGDPDLYVANDYGRNNFFRNDDGEFVEIAAELGVEDMSSGMSVSWGDYNRDGRADVYVSNMFSSAGNRITFQRQFQGGKAGEALSSFKRFARGNTLFSATADNGFEDVSVNAGVTMARWAWGSRFVDLDNDGWEDIVAANGFITARDPGDL